MFEVVQFLGSRSVVDVKSQNQVIGEKFDSGILSLFCDFEEHIVIVLEDRRVLVFDLKTNEIRGPVPSSEKIAKRYLSHCEKQVSLRREQARNINFENFHLPKRSFFFEANVWQIAEIENRFYIGLENGKVLCLE
jgi:hypothetical protein